MGCSASLRPWKLVNSWLVNNSLIVVKVGNSWLAAS